MKCQQCGEDKSIWTEMATISFEIYPGRTVMKIVCHDCLGWKKSKMRKEK